MDSPTPGAPLACTTASTSWAGGHLELEDQESSVRVPLAEDHMAGVVGAHPEEASSLVVAAPAAPTSMRCCNLTVHLLVATSSRRNQVQYQVVAHRSDDQGLPAVSS